MIIVKFCRREENFYFFGEKRVLGKVESLNNTNTLAENELTRMKDADLTGLKYWENIAEQMRKDLVNGNPPDPGQASELLKIENHINQLRTNITARSSVSPSVVDTPVKTEEVPAQSSTKTGTPSEDTTEEAVVSEPPVHEEKNKNGWSELSKKASDFLGEWGPLALVGKGIDMVASPLLSKVGIDFSFKKGMDALMSEIGGSLFGSNTFNWGRVSLAFLTKPTEEKQVNTLSQQERTPSPSPTNTEKEVGGNEIVGELGSGDTILKKGLKIISQYESSHGTNVWNANDSGKSSWGIYQMQSEVLKGFLTYLRMNGKEVEANELSTFYNSNQLNNSQSTHDKAKDFSDRLSEEQHNYIKDYDVPNKLKKIMLKVPKKFRNNTSDITKLLLININHQFLSSTREKIITDATKGATTEEEFQNNLVNSAVKYTKTYKRAVRNRMMDLLNLRDNSKYSNAGNKSQMKSREFQNMKNSVKDEKIYREVVSSMKPGKRKELLDLAWYYLGVNESENAGMVRRFHKIAKKQNLSEKVAWCMSWFQTVLSESGNPHFQNTAWAKDGLKKGKPVKLSDALPGDVVIVERKNGGGHIGFYLKMSSSGNPIIIAGNRSDQVRVHEEDRPLLGVRRIV